MKHEVNLDSCSANSDKQAESRLLTQIKRQLASLEAILIEIRDDMREHSKTANELTKTTVEALESSVRMLDEFTRRVEGVKGNGSQDPDDHAASGGISP